MRYYFIRQSDIKIKMMLLAIIILIITSCAGVKTIDENDIITSYTENIDSEKGVVVFSSRSIFTQTYIGQAHRSTPRPCGTIIDFKNVENNRKFSMKGEYDSLTIYPMEPGEYTIFQVNLLTGLDYKFSVERGEITYLSTFITDNWRHTNLMAGSEVGTRSIEYVDEFSEAQQYIKHIKPLKGWNFHIEDSNPLKKWFQSVNDPQKSQTSKEQNDNERINNKPYREELANDLQKPQESIISKKNTEKSDSDLSEELFRAIDKSDINKVADIIDHHIEKLNIQDDEGFTPLMRACRNCNFDITWLLIWSGSEVDFKNSDGYTALDVALANGCASIEEDGKSIVRLLTEKGAKSYIDNDMSKDLRSECSNDFNNSLSEMRIIDGGISKNTTSVNNNKGIVLFSSSSTFTETYTGQVHSSTPQKVSTLLAVTNLSNCESFFLAGGHNSMAAYELEPGDYRIFMVNFFGGGLDYQFSIEAGTITYIGKFITENWQNTTLGPKGGVRRGSRFLECLDEFSNAQPAVSQVNVLKNWPLKNGSKPVRIDEKGMYGESQLMRAVANGMIDRIRFLIEEGADVNAQNNKGNTVLMYAIDTCNKEVAELLLKNGANPNLLNNQKLGALAMAIIVGDYNMVRLLLKNGAHVNVKNEDGSVDLILAAKAGKVDIVKLLIEYRLDVNMQDDNGETALIAIAATGKKDGVEALIQVGADVNAKNSQGQTALMVAAEFGYTDIVKMLIENGANP